MLQETCPSQTWPRGPRHTQRRKPNWQILTTMCPGQDCVYETYPQVWTRRNSGLFFRMLLAVLKPPLLRYHVMSIKKYDIKLERLYLFQVKILRSTERVDSKGVGRSMGYGFVEFSDHDSALLALRATNNNPTIFGKMKVCTIWSYINIF